MRNGETGGRKDITRVTLLFCEYVYKERDEEEWEEEEEGNENERRNEAEKMMKMNT